MYAIVSYMKEHTTQAIYRPRLIERPRPIYKFDQATIALQIVDPRDLALRRSALCIADCRCPVSLHAWDWAVLQSYTTQARFFKTSKYFIRLSFGPGLLPSPGKPIESCLSQVKSESNFRTLRLVFSWTEINLSALTLLGLFTSLTCINSIIFTSIIQHFSVDFNLISV
jgi:hypothetical protein